MKTENSLTDREDGGLSAISRALLCQPLPLKNPVQKYAWGSHRAIQDLMDEPRTSEPWAELWMGAHAKAPSQVQVDGHYISLPALLEKFPEEMLGAGVCEKYNRGLPYLFKVLAAARPLSIQAHPDKARARAGFERETAAGIRVSAPGRNYKDPNHKPECICALTRFSGLKGFRRNTEILALMEQFCPNGLLPQKKFLRQNNLRDFFKSLMEMPETEKASAISAVCENADKNKKKDKDKTEDTAAPLNESRIKDQIKQWIKKLAIAYPGDIGVISPLFLNLFCLEPGEALFLPAGELHAYLEGLGLEVMANSDNVLRGGLTPKHVDVPELMQVLTFTASEVKVLRPEPVGPVSGRYPVPAEEFAFCVLHLTDSAPCRIPNGHSAEILLCTQGHARVSADASPDDGVHLKKGQSVLIPAMAREYQISGSGVCYKVGVP